MQKALFFKLATIVFLCGCFLVGLLFLSSLVYERESYHDSVINDIAKMHVGSQQVISPFIVVPYVANGRCVNSDSNGEIAYKPCKKTYYINQLARETQINSPTAVTSQDYGRGIYRAISYQANLTIKQQFHLNWRDNATVTQAELYQKTPATTGVQWQNAKLILPITDLRGIGELPRISINNKTYAAHYPAQKTLFGLHYLEVDLSPLMANTANRLANDMLQININMPLVGLQSLSVVPLGQNFRFNMQANWADPHFFGDALPTKSFTKDGFSANWHSEYLTVANNQLLHTCLTQKPADVCELGEDDYLGNQTLELKSSDFKRFNVQFINANDAYQHTDRTLKYALLILLVSFGTFFLFEVIKGLRIHPIQYVLVAAALLVFYVLLLSLAEQIMFWQAYVAASVACVGLIGWYAYYMLGNLKRAGAFSALLASLYAAFYLILASEDMNLLMGAVFCFVLLAAVMYFTRKINWYEVA